MPLLKVMQEDIRVTTKDFGELFALDEAESFGFKPEFDSPYKPFVCDAWLLLHIRRSVIGMIDVEGRAVRRRIFLVILSRFGRAAIGIARGHHLTHHGTHHGHLTHHGHGIHGIHSITAAALSLVALRPLSTASTPVTTVATPSAATTTAASTASTASTASATCATTSA